jgi:hypothetical protein
MSQCSQRRPTGTHLRPAPLLHSEEGHSSVNHGRHLLLVQHLGVGLGGLHWHRDGGWMQESGPGGAVQRGCSAGGVCVRGGESAPERGGGWASESQRHVHRWHKQQSVVACPPAHCQGNKSPSTYSWRARPWVVASCSLLPPPLPLRPPCAGCLRPARRRQPPVSRQDWQHVSGSLRQNGAPPIPYLGALPLPHAPCVFVFFCFCFLQRVRQRRS